ncbi:MAG: heavy-metal-associated domain-containing protein [Magnetococcales bacterium]|nr:heavy-metal-associated domain-containing protein [Magnetococcales bacterium]
MVPEPWNVTHDLKVAGMVCAECAEIIAEGLGALNGVLKVVTHWHRNTVTVTYDLQRVRIHALEKLLTEIGFPPDPGFIQRKKRDWIRFVDQNTLDAMKHRGACCNRPPR